MEDKVIAKKTIETKKEKAAKLLELEKLDRAFK